ncbi:sigma-70 family RNA polymerase sigma factor [Limnospira fusiformis KN01]|uniref:sigma-70 family RNA polymerase sigma factor n=1 Tax=Limnospira TaxID=2596745 RepID=UPI001658779E|nr:MULTISPECIES: sigma-70 family RNA polymerase sigma factor [Limnospira]MDT9197271.1 sigma-70 family RNA polymerase sigma factor [Limnospira sp. PMC 1042.18]ULB44110.1 sigma-70 family RNA polymerase sigma factor [Limnospira fusiformis KN01]
MMNDQLQLLIAETCRHPPGSLKRQQGLTQLYRIIVNSGKLWREKTPYYEEVWQQTWLYFCLNLCEATTGKEKYDSDRSSITTWLNVYLKMRLKDRAIKQQKQQQQMVSASQALCDDDTLTFLDTLEAPPDIPPILQATRQWAETDPEGELQRVHLRGRKDVTCQLLILRRLPPETTWEDLSAQLGLPVSTLSSFYQRKCLPQLRKFGKSAGYL